MRRWTAWISALLALAGLGGAAYAQTVARGQETYPVGGFRLIPAVGAPSAGLCTAVKAGATAAGDGGSTLYMCDGAGTWNAVASGGGPGVPGISASGTQSASWTTNTDIVAGDDEDSSLVLRGADAAGETNSVFLSTLRQTNIAGGTVIVHDLYATDDGVTADTVLSVGKGFDADSRQSIFLLSAGDGATARTAQMVLGTAGGLELSSFANVVSFTIGLASTFNDSVTFKSNVDLGDAVTDTISFVGVVDTDVIPDGANARSLGSAGSDFLAMFTRAVTAGTGAPLALTGNGLSANAASGTVTLYSSTGAADYDPQVTVGAAGTFLADADVDATLWLRGHQVGDALATGTSASLVVDSSADLLVITPPSGGSTSIAAGNVSLAASATIDGLDPSALAVATPASEGALLVGSSQTGTGYGDGATVEARLDDLAGDVGTVAGAASSAQSTAAAAIPKATLAAGNTILVGTAASTPDDLAISEGHAPCYPAAGSLQSCDASTMRTLIGVAASGDTLLTSLATVADQVLYSTGASAWAALTVDASTILGKGAAGTVDALTPSEARAVLEIDPAAAGDVVVGTAVGTVTKVTITANTVLGDDGTGVEALDATEILALIGVESGADVTDATNVDAAGAVMESDFDAQTILAATADNTPAAVTVGEAEIVGRSTGGNVGSLNAAAVRTIINVADGADDVNATTVGAAGALMATTCAAANTLWGCTADDTAAILTPAQVRTATGQDGIQIQPYTTTAQPDGGDNNADVADPICAGTDCYTLITTQAASQDYTDCAVFHIPAWATAFDASAGVTLRYKVTATGTLGLEVYDANDAAGSPCYAPSAGSSTSYATITATAANLSSCTIPTGGLLRVCGKCSGTTSDTCFLSTVTVDVE